MGAYRRDSRPERTVKLVHGKETRYAHLTLSGVFEYDAPGLALEIKTEIGLEMKAVNQSGKKDHRYWLSLANSVQPGTPVGV